MSASQAAQPESPGLQAGEDVNEWLLSFRQLHEKARRSRRLLMELPRRLRVFLGLSAAEKERVEMFVFDTVLAQLTN